MKRDAGLTAPLPDASKPEDSHFGSKAVSTPCQTMEKKTETTIVYWGYIGIMEKEMGTTTIGYVGVYVGHILG